MDEKEVYELILGLQAEISALKIMMFEANPLMAARHQTLTDDIRQQLLSAWKSKQRRKK